MPSVEDMLLIFHALLRRLGLSREEAYPREERLIEDALAKPSAQAYALLTEVLRRERVYVPAGHHVLVLYKKRSKVLRRERLVRRLYCCRREYVPDSIVPLIRLDFSWKMKTPPPLVLASHMFNPRLVKQTEGATRTIVIQNFLKTVQVAYYYSMAYVYSRLAPEMCFSMIMTAVLTNDLIAKLRRRLQETPRVSSKTRELCMWCSYVKKVERVPVDITILTKLMKDAIVKTEELRRAKEGEGEVKLEPPNLILIVDEDFCVTTVDWASINDVLELCNNVIRRLIPAVTHRVLFYAYLDVVSPPTAVLIYHQAVPP